MASSSRLFESLLVAIVVASTVLLTFESGVAVGQSAAVSGNSAQSRALQGSSLQLPLPTSTSQIDRSPCPAPHQLREGHELDPAKPCNLTVCHTQCQAGFVNMGGSGPVFCEDQTWQLPEGSPSCVYTKCGEFASGYSLPNVEHAVAYPELPDTPLCSEGHSFCWLRCPFNYHESHPATNTSWQIYLRCDRTRGWVATDRPVIDPEGERARGRPPATELDLSAWSCPKTCEFPISSRSSPLLENKVVQWSHDLGFCTRTASCRYSCARGFTNADGSSNNTELWRCNGTTSEMYIPQNEFINCVKSPPEERDRRGPGDPFQDRAHTSSSSALLRVSLAFGGFGVALAVTVLMYRCFKARQTSERSEPLAAPYAEMRV